MQNWRQLKRARPLESKDSTLTHYKKQHATAGKENNNTNVNSIQREFELGELIRLRSIESCCIGDDRLSNAFQCWISGGANQNKIPTQIKFICSAVDSQLKESQMPICWAPSFCSKCCKESLFVSTCSICGESDNLNCTNWPSSLLVKKGPNDCSINVEEKKIQDCVVRGLQNARKLVKSGKANDFWDNGGDFMFLFRFIVLYSDEGSQIRKEATELYYDLVEKWNKKFSSISEKSNSRETVLFSESLHAKFDLETDREYLETAKDQICERLKSLNAEEFLECVLDKSFSHEKDSSDIPFAAQHICTHCGKCNKKGAPSCLKCKRDLIDVIHYQSICHAIVWAGVFYDINVDFRTANSKTIKVENVLSRLHLVRPYKAIDQIGELAFKEQCYFVTHLLLVLTSWGRYKLCKTDFIPEYIFILQNLNVVIKLGDPEIAGEFLQSLRLLGVANDSYPIQRGISYLVNKEKSLKSKGSWVAPNRDYYTQYHAIYCGIIGIMDFNYQSDKFVYPNRWREIIALQNRLL